MKYKVYIIATSFLLIGIFHINIVSPIYAQGLTLEEIRTILLNNPPNTGDPAVREQTILELDDILKHDSSRTSLEVLNFYNLMMEKVNVEFHQSLTNGIAIWMMYNHGFVIKTQQVVFAFDLIKGYFAWFTLLPEELIREINILFISHPHGDHHSQSIADTVMAYGGYVVFPSEYSSSSMGNIPMGAGDSLTIFGLNVRAHFGLHNEPNRIYEVSTPAGIKIMHTGDNQTSNTLPNVDSIDVLLLNAWVNDSGNGAVVGMRNSITKLTPTVMIPGHIQELAHDYNPGSPTSRVPYEWAFEVDNIPLPSLVQVMAWGEQYLYLKQPVEVVINDENIPAEFKLQQNYPNPFNPTTIIKYDIPEIRIVTLKVYDVLGSEVATLVNEEKPVGSYKIEYDATNLPSGIYFYQLKAGDYTNTNKMILLK